MPGKLNEDDIPVMKTKEQYDRKRKRREERKKRKSEEREKVRFFLLVSLNDFLIYIKKFLKHNYRVNVRKVKNVKKLNA